MYNTDRKIWYRYSHSQVALVVKNPLASAGDIRDITDVYSIPGEEMATHSSIPILTWRIPWIEKPRGLQPMELRRVRHD